MSSASSAASKSLSSGSKSASSALSSASKQASKSLTSASSAASSAAASASAQATDAVKTHYSFLTIVAIIITALAVGIAGLYFSGQADDLFVYLAKKYYKAEAKAEANALEQVGEGQAEGFLKDQLKKNPIMGESELNQVQEGLGGEAAREGLAGVSGKLGGLGKF